MLGKEQQAIQTNRTQIGFGTHLERGKKAATKNIPPPKQQKSLLIKINWKAFRIEDGSLMHLLLNLKVQKRTLVSQISEHGFQDQGKWAFVICIQLHAFILPFLMTFPASNDLYFKKGDTTLSLQMVEVTQFCSM